MMYNNIKNTSRRRFTSSSKSSGSSAQQTRSIIVKTLCQIVVVGDVSQEKRKTPSEARHRSREKKRLDTFVHGRIND